MDMMKRNSLVVSLEGLERYVGWKPPVRMVGWFKDHTYWHRGVPVEGDNISLVVAEEGGTKIDLVDGVEVDSSSLSAPRVGCVAHGCRVFTRATVRRDELIFQYAPGVLASGGFPFAGGVFPSTPEFTRLVREVLELLDRVSEPGMADRLDLLALQLVTEVRCASVRGPDPVDPRIYRIAARLATDCGRVGGVEDFAREYGFSRSAFYRAWRQYSATPPGEVLRGNRLRLAEQLMSSTRLGLKEIAFRCGFRDGVGLTQAFTACYGVPPREFIRKK